MSVPKRMAMAPACLCILSAAEAPLPAPASITYQAGACLGHCPVYRLTVNADGSGVVEGQEFTPVKGPRRFKASAAQFAAFARELAPLRPRRGAIRYDPNSRCGPSITDAPSVRVSWHGARRSAEPLFLLWMRPQTLRGDRGPAPARTDAAASRRPHPVDAAREAALSAGSAATT